MIFRIITVLSMIATGLSTYFLNHLPWVEELLMMVGIYLGTYLALTLLACLFLLAACAFVDLSKPQTEDSKFYRAILYPYVDFLRQAVGMTVHAEGLEKTPKDGRFLLVCNHQNESDPGVLFHCFPQSQLAFISKKEARNMFVVGKFMHKTLCQMIDRENDREALKTILKCIQMIRDDQVSVGAFPEGGIKGDYKVYPFRPGMFKIAQKAGVPIAVCTIKGTTDLFRNIKRLKRTQVHVHLVDVIPAEELKGVTTVEIADRVYEMMIADLGEDWRYTEE